MDDAYLGRTKRRFWAKVKKSNDPDGCWEWTGSQTSLGYGELLFDGKKVYTHRISWYLTNGPIPDGIRILHLCENRLCVNPKHLVLDAESKEMRFWNKTKKQKSGCWEWTGSKFKSGYGQVRIKRKLARAHRIAWELVNGPIPKGMCVLHRCDNPPCVNPDHLFLGTQSENMQDMVEKDRRGLTMLQKQEIRKRYAKGVVFQRELADEYGVTRSYISIIISGKN